MKIQLQFLIPYLMNLFHPYKIKFGLHQQNKSKKNLEK